MSRSKRVFLMAIVLVLCAGLVVGRLSARLVPPPMPPHDHSPSWLQDQLGLTSEQKQQMDSIWADTKSQIGKTWDGRHELDKQRDDAVHNLLTTEQQAAFTKIYDDYHAKRQSLEKQRDDLIKTAEDRSRSLLSDPQKTQWDTLTKEMHDHHGPNGDHHGPPSSQWSHGMHDPMLMGPPPGEMPGRPTTGPYQ